MGLIIKDKIQMLIKGYPTVSDKYNVSGAVLTGSNAVKFGDPVVYSTTKGYFEAIPGTGVTSAADIAGFVLATNVKLAEGFPGSTVQVNPGEAFNLLVSGFMAIELDSGATTSYIAAGKGLALILATGKLTTIDKVDSTSQTVTTVELPGVVLTGTYENQGTSASPKYIAEIYIK